MSNDYVEKTKSFVDTAFGLKKDHFERTLFWLMELEPESDIALKVAAYSHDMERAFRPKNSKRFLIYEDKNDLTGHQKESAAIMHDFLIDNGADNTLAERVRHLIEKHEEGGDQDQNILKDADSISYLETNAPKHIEEMKSGIFAPPQVKEKFNYMFNRITSPKAKEIARPMYDKVINLLEKDN